MAKKTISVENMGIGKQLGGKHWTAAEVSARESAAKGMRRKKRVHLKMPAWLSDEAQKIWQRKKRQVAGLELLDNVDDDVLAIYCDAVAKYKLAAQDLVVVNEEGESVASDEAIKSLQAWARLIKSYAETLGFTKAARTRLAKKKADDILDDFENEFGG